MLVTATFAAIIGGVLSSGVAFGIGAEAGLVALAYPAGGVAGIALSSARVLRVDKRRRVAR